MLIGVFKYVFKQKVNYPKTPHIKTTERKRRSQNRHFLSVPNSIFQRFQLILRNFFKFHFFLIQDAYYVQYFSHIRRVIYAVFFSYKTRYMYKVLEYYYVFEYSLV